MPVSHDETFEALRNGDFQAALPALEKAAAETGFTSEILNHAYTLALYRAGEKARLADISFRIGKAFLKESPGIAMDYFQRAMFAGLDTNRVRQIGEVHESWSAPTADVDVDRPQKRVAHVLGCLLPGHAPTQYLRMLTASLSLQGIQSTVFTTEWAASWFFNPHGVGQSETLDIEAEVRLASVEGDFLERAEKVALAIRASHVDIVFYHASLSEQITARVASFRPAPIQVNVNHGSEMAANLFDGCIHLFQNAIERTRFPERLSEWIPLASDIESRLHQADPVARQSLGLESASSVSGTFGNLYKVSEPGYIRVLIEILKRFPRHFHIFAGAGNVKALRGALHSAGVLPRVRFLGHTSDVAPLLNALDVYLASFPHSGGHSLLEAMGASKPIVVLRHAPDSHYNSGAEIVGLRELTAANEPEYIEIADRLLRNAALRERFGHAMKERFRSEFRPERLGERYSGFIEKLLASRAEKD